MMLDEWRFGERRYLDYGSLVSLSPITHHAPHA